MNRIAIQPPDDDDDNDRIDFTNPQDLIRRHQIPRPPSGQPPYQNKQQRHRPQPENDRQQTAKQKPIQSNSQGDRQMADETFERTVRQRALTLDEWALILELFKYSGYVIAIADGVFSFWALKVSLNNAYMALILAYAIGAVLFILGVLISLRGIDSFLGVDRDGDGRVSRGEVFWWAVRAASVGIVVVTDVSTNYFGITELTARSLLPAELVPGWVVSLVLSIFLMVSAHVIIAGCDAGLMQIGRKYAAADLERAETRGLKDYAGGVGTELVINARDQGRKDGKAKPTSWNKKLRW